MRMLIYLLLLLMAGQTGPIWAAEGKGTSISKLVSEHLDQAAMLDKNSSASLTVPATEKISKDWIAQLSLLPRESQLLEGVPAEVWALVEPARTDEAKVRQILEKPVSLPMLLALAALRDPQIQSSYEALRASVRRLPQAEYLNDLLIRYRAFLREVDTTVGRQVHKEKPQSYYPFPAGLTLGGQIAQLQIELARIEFESVLRKRLNQVARDYYQLLYVKNAIDITTENRALAVNMESVAIAQLKVARATQADALRAQTIVDVLDDRLHALEQERETVTARLNSSLILEGARPITIVKTESTAPQADCSKLIEQALEASQDVAASHKRLQLLKASTRLVETAFPLASSGASRIDLNSGAEAGPTRSSSSTFPEKVTAGHMAAGLGSTLAYLEELKLRQQELAENVRSIEAEVEYRVRAASLRLKASENSLQVHDQLVVPKLRRVYSTTLEQYNTDRASFIEFATTGRDYLDAQLDRERAHFERHLSLIDLQDALGRTVLDILSSQMED